MGEHNLKINAQQALPLTFPIAVGLLERKHVAEIGAALWCYLWCIDRTTEDVMRGGERRGKVLGGRPVPVSRIAQELGLPEKDVQCQLDQLARRGYIERSDHPEGCRIEVRRSIKWLCRNRSTRKKQASAPPTFPSPDTRQVSGEPAPMRSLVEQLKERWDERDAAAAALTANTDPQK
jgi:hypothetical protein